MRADCAPRQVSAITTLGALRWFSQQPSEKRRAIPLADFPELADRGEEIAAEWDAKIAEQDARRRAREAERAAARL